MKCIMYVLMQIFEFSQLQKHRSPKVLKYSKMGFEAVDFEIIIFKSTLVTRIAILPLAKF